MKKIQYINLKRIILKNILDEDFGYLLDDEIEEMFDKTKEDNTYYIKELESILLLNDKKINSLENNKGVING